jgi:hypothetical protein
MEATDLILNRENNGNIVSAGYEINSELLRNNQPTAVMRGGDAFKFLDSLKLGELAVPVGLFYLQDIVKKSSDSFNSSVFELYDNHDDDDKTVKVIEESLYDKLLKVVGPNYEQPHTTSKFTRRKKDRRVAKKTRKV